MIELKRLEGFVKVVLQRKTVLMVLAAALAQSLAGQQMSDVRTMPHIEQRNGHASMSVDGRLI